MPVPIGAGMKTLKEESSMKLWSSKLFLFALIAAMVLSLGAFVACSSGDDDDDDDDTSADDDIFDDDAADDDATAVDDDDDDHPPVLSDGGWDPTELEVAEFQGANYWYSALFWSVCDTGNDLLGGGAVYFYLSGTTDQFLEDQPIDWEDFNNPPEIDLSAASDCSAPVQTGINILFGEEASPPAAGDYCVDMEATDAAGSFSNLLEELCVTMPAA